MNMKITSKLMKFFSSFPILFKKVICVQVSETSNQVGRVSVSTPNNMPYKEMAGQCEALRMEKQEKISTFFTAQQRQESSIRTFCDYNQGKEVSSSSIVQLDFPMVLPFTSYVL